MEEEYQHISQLLKELDFQFERSDTSSIFFVSDLEKDKNLHPKIILDLDKARIFKADAVYFRFFDGDRLPQPQIYIYDNFDKKNSVNYYAEIHRNIWSASEIPIFIVVEKTRIKIFDSRVPISIKDEKLISKPINEIDIEKLEECSDVIKQYNAQKFDSGSFWESEIANSHFLSNKTAYEKLISGLRSLRNHFKAQSGLSPELSDQLLILSILVKYLEENGQYIDGRNLAHEFFFEKTGFYSFPDIIRNGKIIILFSELAKHFNGGLFKLTDSQKEELGQNKISVLANFLEGKIGEKDRFVIWSEYSFKHIPVELISNFYEEFLPKEKKAGSKKETKKDTGAVFTPGFLVNFLIDECLPLNRNELNENVRLNDVSCGSGIFLATAFKRLVQRWRIRNAKNGHLADTNPEILKKILLDNIYGVDTDKNAVELTIFSLNLSLCAMLTPQQIWTQLKFDDLKENGNIIQKDFFEYFVENKPRDFDLIIGNPPFKALNKNEYEKYVKFLVQNNTPFSCKIPDNQLALMFLDKAMCLLKDNGLLCLITPSGPMLYNNTLDFRSRFFECYNIPQIIDFTFLRNSLFVDANVAVAALFVQKQKPDNSDILHITVRRTKANKEKNYFEIDHYDFHDVPKSVAKTSDFVWKCNLIGGGRIYNLVQRLKEPGSITLKNYLQRKNNENHWDYGQGYIVGLANRKFKAEYITGKLSVIDKKFTEKGIEETEIQDAEYFKDKSKEIIFHPPHLLIKKTIGKMEIPIEFRDDYLTFRNEVIGIHCPNNDINELLLLANIFKQNNQLFRFHITATSARFGVGRTPYTILLEDITDLPFIENEVNLSFAEKILISDTVEFTVDQFAFGENAKINIEISDHQILQDFSDIYCKALNSIYQENEKKYGLSKIYVGSAFFACEYNFTNTEVDLKTTNSEADFNALIDNWNNRNVLIKRVVRFYNEDKIIMIKPKQLRYWLKSIALRDADETLEESFTQYPNQ